MNSTKLFKNINKKRTFLCIGLDTDIQRIPKYLQTYSDPVFEFNKQIVDATQEFAVSYKPNTAFYESNGIKGWQSLQKTAEYIKQTYPDIFLIADAKRGDIGNTSKMYAKAFFEDMPFDAVTLSPYMGCDTIAPFLEYKDKWAIILAVTSNDSASDFQFSMDSDSNQELYEKILSVSKSWGTPDNLMYVVGATKASLLKDVRLIVPNHFLLVPGIGAQGGSLSETAGMGMNRSCGLIVNSSRGIIYASQGKDFAEKAAEKATEIQKQMAELLRLLL